MVNNQETGPHRAQHVKVKPLLSGPPIKLNRGFTVLRGVRQSLLHALASCFNHKFCVTIFHACAMITASFPGSCRYQAIHCCVTALFY